MNREERIERLAAETDRTKARAEVVEKLLEGEKVGSLPSVDLEHVLDQVIDNNHAGAVRDLYELLAGIGSKNSDDACLRINDWLKRKCESYVDRHASLLDDYIEEQATAFEDEGDEMRETA